MIETSKYNQIQKFNVYKHILMRRNKMQLQERFMSQIVCAFAFSWGYLPVGPQVDLPRGLVSAMVASWEVSST
jgi:hypothetical protein